MDQLFHEEVLPHIDAPVVIFFDEIDTVLSPDFRFSTDAFFASLRSLYEEVRGSFSKKPRLTFCLIGVCHTGRADQRPGPFAFNLDNSGCIWTTSRRGKPNASAWSVGSAGEQCGLAAHVMSWTDGHPYMTQRVCQYLVDKPQTDNGNPC